jgi:hypothetical protein
MIACILVTAFFLLSAVLVPVLVRRLVLPSRKKKILVAAIIFSVLAKLVVTQVFIAALGPNPQSDINTWKYVAGLMAKHKNVYTERSVADDFCVTSDGGCYNFAPAWAWIVFGLDRLSNLLHGRTIASFRFALTAFLATTDVLIALVLACQYSYTAALVFLLSPLFIWLEVIWLC